MRAASLRGVSSESVRCEPASQGAWCESLPVKYSAKLKCESRKVRVSKILIHVYEIEPTVWGRVGPLDCLLRYPNVAAGIRLECRNMLSIIMQSDLQTRNSCLTGSRLTTRTIVNPILIIALPSFLF